MKKFIEKQIKEQTRNSLGFAEIKDVKGFIFKKTPVGFVSPIVWTKWWYKYNRGTYVEISDELFQSTDKELVKAILPPNSNGALLDSRTAEYHNARYAVDVYVSDNTEITVPIKAAKGTTIYLETFYWTNVDDDLYNEEKHKTVVIAPSKNVASNNNVTIALVGGQWTTISLYTYHASDGGFVIAFDYLLKYIDSWRYPDYDAPTAPKWADPPLITKSNSSTKITKDALGWLYPKETDWAGHLVYRVKENTNIAYITPRDVIDNKSLSYGGSYDYTGNNGFMLDRVSRKRLNVGTKLKIRNRYYTLRSSKRIFGNLIDNGIFDIYNSTSNAFQGWDFYKDTAGIERDVCTSYPDYINYQVGGSALLCSCVATNTTKSYYFESTPITKVNNGRDYLLSYNSIGKYADGKVQINFYSDSAKTACSTSGTSIGIYSSSYWAQKDIYLFSNTSIYYSTPYDIWLPSDCKYLNLRFYSAYNTSGAIIRRFDAIKFSQYNSNNIYSLQTSDATYIETKENLSVPRSNNTTMYNSLDGSGQILGTFYYLGQERLRTHKVFNCFDGGYEVFMPVRNEAKNGKFETTDYWNTYRSRLISSTSNIYNPPFGSACGIISCNIDNIFSSSYIYQSTINSHTSGSYILSVYAKSDTTTSLFLGIYDTTNGISYSNYSLTKNWERYYIVSSVSDASSTKSFYIGVSTGYYGKILVNGSQLEYSSDSCYPRQFNEDHTDGLTYNSFSMPVLTMAHTTIGVPTSAGSIRLYYTPNYDADAVSTSYYKTLFIISEECLIPYYGGPSGYFKCSYIPSLKRFSFHWRYGSGNLYRDIISSSDSYSTAQSFSAGDRICIHCTYHDNEIQIFTDGISGATASYQPEHNLLYQLQPTKPIAVTIGSDYPSGYYFVDTAPAALIHPADGVLTDVIVSKTVPNGKVRFIDTNATGIAPDPGIGAILPSEDNRVVTYSYELLYDRKRTEEDNWYIEEEDLNNYDEEEPTELELLNNLYPEWQMSSTPIMIWEHEPLTPNTTYTYALRCYDSKGNKSAFSEWASIIAGDEIAPGPITDTGTIQAYGAVTWYWTNPSDDDFTHCRIYSGDVSTSANIINTIYGEPSKKMFFTQSLSEPTSIYVTTLDFNGNEDTTDAVRITGEPLSVEQAIQDLTVSWEVMDPSRVPYMHFRTDDNAGGPCYTIGGSQNLFNVTLTSLVAIDFSGAAYGLSITDSTLSALPLKDAEYSTVTNDADDYSGNIYHYYWHDLHITQLDSTDQRGKGFIYFKGLVDVAEVEKSFTVMLDDEAPTITGLSINEGASGSSRIIHGSFTTSGTDSMYYYLSTADVPTPGSGWGTDPNGQALVLPSTVKQYTVYGWVMDKALNKSLAYTTTYTLTDVVIPMKIIFDPPNPHSTNDGNWWHSCLGITIEAEEIGTETISRVSWSIFDVDNMSAAYYSDSYNGNSTTFSFCTDGRWVIYASAVSVHNNRGEAGPEKFDIDTTNPSVPDPFLNSKTLPHNNGVYFDWHPNYPTDNGSGMYQYWIYRKRYGVSGDHPEYNYSLINVLPMAAGDNIIHGFTDSEDTLESYTQYEYNIWAVDKALNTSLAVDTVITMSPNWEMTFRNWLDNGSFELTENDTIDEDDCLSWYVDASGGDGVSENEALFGAKSAGIIYGGSGIAQKVMLGDFGYFCTASTRWVISYWFKGTSNTNAFYVSLFYYDYAGNLISGGDGVQTFTTFGSGASNIQTPLVDSVMVDASGETWKRRFVAISPNDFSSTRKTAVYAKLSLTAYNSGGNHYIDGIQWEDVGVDPDNPQPSKFRDNRTMTTDRLHVGFVRANMIKVGDLHAGLFHAQGIEITDAITGAPYLTIGNYNESSSFIRFTKQGGQRHFQGMGIGQGYDFISHVESGMREFPPSNGSGIPISFSNRFVDWVGNPITPNVIIQPIVMKTYDIQSIATSQYFEYGSYSTPGGFYPYCTLSTGYSAFSYMYPDKVINYGNYSDIDFTSTPVASDVMVEFIIGEDISYDDMDTITVDFSLYDGSWHATNSLTRKIITHNYGHVVNHLVKNNYSATKLRVSFSGRTGATPIANIFVDDLRFYTGNKNVINDGGMFKWIAF